MMYSADMVLSHPLISKGAGMIRQRRIDCSHPGIKRSSQLFALPVSRYREGTTRFAFLEFDDPRDAEDAVRREDGADMGGARMRVRPSSCNTSSQICLCSFMKRFDWSGKCVATDLLGRVDV